MTPLKGELTEQGEHATLFFRRVYPHPVQAVWDAISTPEGLRDWLLCTKEWIGHATSAGQ